MASFNTHPTRTLINSRTSVYLVLEIPRLSHETSFGHGQVAIGVTAMISSRTAFQVARITNEYCVSCILLITTTNV